MTLNGWNPILYFILDQVKQMNQTIKLAKQIHKGGAKWKKMHMGKFSLLYFGYVSYQVKMGNTYI